MVIKASEAYKYLLDLNKTAVIQQHGVDITVKEIRKVFHNNPDTGVYVNRPTCPADELVIGPAKKINFTADPAGIDNDEKIGWQLSVGIYSVYFDQGVLVPENTKANIIHRSSIARCGGQIYSGEYDAGFRAKNMGAFLVVRSPFFIEYGSRIAQIVFHRVEEGGTLYNGQWQQKN